MWPTENKVSSQLTVVPRFQSRYLLLCFVSSDQSQSHNLLLYNCLLLFIFICYSWKLFHGWVSEYLSKQRTKVLTLRNKTQKINMVSYWWCNNNNIQAKLMIAMFNQHFRKNVSFDEQIWLFFSQEARLLSDFWRIGFCKTSKFAKLNNYQSGNFFLNDNILLSIACSHA